MKNGPPNNTDGSQPASQARGEETGMRQNRQDDQEEKPKPNKLTAVAAS
jgi:hypothetical protein